MKYEGSFRPLSGIIYFNKVQYRIRPAVSCFRPLSGIIYFNIIFPFVKTIRPLISFRPLSGIIYFNNCFHLLIKHLQNDVSVPSRGLSILIGKVFNRKVNHNGNSFRPLSGIIYFNKVQYRIRPAVSCFRPLSGIIYFNYILNCL